MLYRSMKALITSLASVVHVGALLLQVPENVFILGIDDHRRPIAGPGRLRPPPAIRLRDPGAGLRDGLLQGGVREANRGGRRVQWADKGWATDADRSRIPVMTADVILESHRRRLILDTKFYKDALARGRGSGTGKLHSGNLYQLLAYLRNREATQPRGAKHDGILLYPQVGSEPLRADTRLEGFRIQARTVNLNRDWRAIHREMLATIAIDGLNSA